MIVDNDLKQKMIISGIAVIIIPFVITGTIIYIQLSGSLMKMAKDESLHVSKDIVRGLDHFCDANLRLITTIASDPDIIHASNTGDYKATMRALNSISKRIQLDKIAIFLTDKNGIVRGDSHFPNQLGLDLSDREYFIKARQGVPNVSDPIFARGKSDSETIIVLCSPMFKDNVFLGICGMIFTTRYIADIISETTTGKAGYVYLLSKNGLILLHPNPEFTLKYNLFELPATQMIKELVLSGRPGVASYTFDGIPRIAGLSQVERTGWTAAYVRTKDEIVAPANRILGYVAASGFFFVVATIATVIIVFGRISSPIEQMMEAVSQVTKHATEVIIQIGLNREIFYVNPAFEKITGIKIEDIIGTVPSFKNNNQTPSQTIWQALESGESWSGQLEFQAGASKKAAILEVMIIPVRDGNDRIRGYLQIGRDVTDELMFEKRMNQAQKLESIGTLAGGIAHDFNNILSIIFAYAELALRGSDISVHTEKSLRQILLASERARELVTQILSFSRQADVEQVCVRFDSIIKEALKLVRASTPSFITIESDITSTACVLADPTHIHQVVMNLFTNAVHAIGENPGTITLTLKEFLVDREFIKTHPGIDQGLHLLLRITDTGCGMSAKTVEHIFDPFFSTKPTKKGTGLGLSVVHGIVKKLNGIITVYSHPGEGAIFNVLLPVINDDASDLPQVNADIKQGTERIALIDDEINITGAMQSILISLGYQVTTFNDSTAALSDIQSRPDEFDLIITDYTMPDLTGLDIVKKLRRDGILIPVILISGFLDKPVEMSAKEAGITQLLYKPTNTYLLAESIRKALGDQKS